MDLREWIPIEKLKAFSNHGIAVAGALVTFSLTASLAHYLMPDSMFVEAFEVIEFVIFVVLLVKLAVDTAFEASSWGSKDDRFRFLVA